MQASSLRLVSVKRGSGHRLFRLDFCSPKKNNVFSRELLFS